MSDAKRCDGCADIIRDTTRAGFVSIPQVYHRKDAKGLLYQMGPLDFCGFACLILWSQGSIDMAESK